MGKTLIVAEKLSVAREIAEALGGCSKVDGWVESASIIVSSGIGHLVEIHSPEAATAGKDLASLPIIPPKFELQAIAKTKAQFSMLSKLMKRADVDLVVNACDAGREGELIFRLIYELAGCRKPVKRMWLRSMTQEAIRENFRNMRPGSEFDALGDAAKCRSEADWLIGINGSRGITRLHEQKTQSYVVMAAGRVQTPTLAILAHREWAIRTFIPKDYWEVHATFGAQAGSYVGKWVNPASPKTVTEGDDDEESTSGSRFFNRAEADAIVARCKGVAPSSVTDVSKTTTSAPPKLFDLTSLQREANIHYKFSAKKTLDIAQALYERHKATSYPRTDASALPEDYVEKAKEVLKTFGGSVYAPHADRVLQNDWVKPDKRIFNNAKISDHFAIIPTGTRPAGLDESEAKIFDMVVRRFIAVFHPAAEYHVTTRISVVSGEAFKSSGKVLVQQGWLEVYGPQQVNAKTPLLCRVTPGEPVRTVSVDAKGLKTQPPARFTEATLLSAMEGAGKLVDDEELRDAMKEKGLGTPATRATIIEGLLYNKDSQERAKEPYATREGEQCHLVPTAKGLGLIEFLETNGVEALTSPRMTGEWEHKLLQIEKGEISRQAFMADIAAMTTHIINVIRQKAASLPVATQKLLGVPCPKCSGDVVTGQRTFECKSGCGFKLWRDICQHILTETEAARLLHDGFLPPLDGFISPNTKRAFTAGLKLNTAEWKAEFVFEDRVASSASTAAPSGALLQTPCPICGAAMRDQGRNFACDKGDFTLRKEVAGRTLSMHEASRLIANKSHPPLSGFTSSKGRAFSAGLRLKRDGKVEFVFDNN
jgi:DNA topoisomerase-3